jgi:hypothetical protein
MKYGFSAVLRGIFIFLKQVTVMNLFINIINSKNDFEEIGRGLSSHKRQHASGRSNFLSSKTD